MGYMRNVYKIVMGKPEAGRDHSNDAVEDGRIILEWSLGKFGGKMWTGFICLSIRTSGGLL
jgi:hypothetical protein